MHFYYTAAFSLLGFCLAFFLNRFRSESGVSGFLSLCQVLLSWLCSLHKIVGWFFHFFLCSGTVYRLFERSLWLSWSLEPFWRLCKRIISIVYIFCWIISRCGSLKYFKINFAWSTVSPLIFMLRLFFTPGSFLSSYFSLLLLFCLIHFSKIPSIRRLNHWLGFFLIIFSFCPFSQTSGAPLHYQLDLFLCNFNSAL